MLVLLNFYEPDHPSVVRLRLLARHAASSPTSCPAVRPSARACATATASSTWNGHAVGPRHQPALLRARRNRRCRVVDRARRRHAHLDGHADHAGGDAPRSPRGGARLALPAINGYLTSRCTSGCSAWRVRCWSLRPGNKDARLAALSLAYWAGSIVHVPRARLRRDPRARSRKPLHAPLFFVDAIFVAGFFALQPALRDHLSERARTRAPACGKCVPYVAALPIFLETLAHGLRRLRGDVGRRSCRGATRIRPSARRCCSPRW